MPSLRVNWTELNNKPPPISSQNDDLPNFQIQIAKGQLEKPIATVTLKFDIGDKFFAEHFVVLNKADCRVALHETQ